MTIAQVFAKWKATTWRLSVFQKNWQFREAVEKRLVWR